MNKTRPKYFKMNKYRHDFLTIFDQNYCIEHRESGWGIVGLYYSIL